MKKILCATFLALFMLPLTACNSNSSTQELSPIDSSTSTSSSIPSSIVLEDNQATDTETASPNVTISSVTELQFDSEPWFGVQYRLDNSEERLAGYMNTSGTIFANEPNVHYENKNSIGWSESSYTIYDDSGNTIYSSPDDKNLYILESTDNSIYLVQEIRSGLDESAVYVGLMDISGNWLSDPINLSELTGAGPGTRYSLSLDSSINLGEGMLAAYYRTDHENYLILSDTETGNTFSIANVWAHYLKFYNGTMIFQRWDGGLSGGHMGEICSVDKYGTLTTFPVEGDLLAVGANGFLTSSNGLSFYTRSGELVWNFNDYELSDDFDLSLDDNNRVVFAHIIGADLNNYIACISQDSGTLVYQPFRDDYGYIYEHTILTWMNDSICFVNLLNGEILSTAVEFDTNILPQGVVSYSHGLFILRDYDSSQERYNYYFYDPEGHRIQPMLAK